MKKKGFTLIEILSVIVLIGALAVLLRGKFSVGIDKANEAGVKNTFSSFREAAISACIGNKEFSKFNVWDVINTYLDEGLHFKNRDCIALDPWHNPYMIAKSEGRYRFQSMGKDSKFSDDDYVMEVWEDENGIHTAYENLNTGNSENETVTDGKGWDLYPRAVVNFKVSNDEMATLSKYTEKVVMGGTVKFPTVILSDELYEFRYWYKDGELGVVNDPFVVNDDMTIIADVEWKVPPVDISNLGDFSKINMLDFYKIVNSLEAVKQYMSNASVNSAKYIDSNAISDNLSYAYKIQQKFQLQYNIDISKDTWRMMLKTTSKSDKNYLKEFYCVTSSITGYKKGDTVQGVTRVVFNNNGTVKSIDIGSCVVSVGNRGNGGASYNILDAGTFKSNQSIDVEENKKQ